MGAPFWSGEEEAYFVNVIIPQSQYPRGQYEAGVGKTWDELAIIMQEELDHKGLSRRKYRGVMLYEHWYQKVRGKSGNGGSSTQETRKPVAQGFDGSDEGGRVTDPIQENQMNPQHKPAIRSRTLSPESPSGSSSPSGNPHKKQKLDKDEWKKDFGICVDHFPPPPLYKSPYPPMIASKTPGVSSPNLSAKSLRLREIFSKEQSFDGNNHETRNEVFVLAERRERGSSSSITRPTLVAEAQSRTMSSSGGNQSEVSLDSEVREQLESYGSPRNTSMLPSRSPAVPISPSISPKTQVPQATPDVFFPSTRPVQAEQPASWSEPRRPLQGQQLTPKVEPISYPESETALLYRPSSQPQHPPASPEPWTTVPVPRPYLQAHLSGSSTQTQSDIPSQRLGRLRVFKTIYAPKCPTCGRGF